MNKSWIIWRHYKGKKEAYMLTTSREPSAAKDFVRFLDDEYQKQLNAGKAAPGVSFTSEETNKAADEIGLVKIENLFMLI